MTYNVTCVFCGESIGEYRGELSATAPIEAQHFVRLNGTSPPQGGCSYGHCPKCGARINEFEAVLSSLWEALERRDGPMEVILEKLPNETPENQNGEPV